MAKSSASLLTVAALTTLTVLAHPGSAEACGGFFCSQPNNPFELPVAQTAENVLFAMDRDPTGKFKLEAHVQIFYTGPADKFSWVVPVDSEPTLDVGSNATFTALLGATQPRFEVDWEVTGTCKPHMIPSPFTPGGNVADAASGPSADGGAGVDLAFRGNVGPYDASVVRSLDKADPKPLIDWLNQNGYFVSAEGARLIADYVREDKYFVAIRLLNDRSVGEITPLVMRFSGPGPCVPLRLTSIAALKDLKVNLWVLADHRVVPDNYFEIELNQAAIDWFRGGGNYEELVKQAANEAGGNAFTTEFVGATSLLKDAFYQPERYNVALLRMQTTPPDALDEVARQGFPRDVALLKILRTHIPVPAELMAMNVDERTFYNQLRFYWETKRALFKPFVATAFAGEIEASLIEPLRKVQALVDGHAKLTRLSTFISPEEMTLDPTFVQNPSLPDVPLRRAARGIRHCGNAQFDVCTAPVQLVVPDGQQLWFVPQSQGGFCYGGAQYQPQKVAQPALARGWKRTSDGAGELKFDKAADIAQAVRMHNALVAPALPPGLMAAAGDAGPVAPADGGVDGSRDGGADGRRHAPGRVTSRGCGCELGRPAGRMPAASLLGLVGLCGVFGLMRKRRRVRSP